jgi:hypothetical protein
MGEPHDEADESRGFLSFLKERSLELAKTVLLIFYDFLAAAAILGTLHVMAKFLEESKSTGGVTPVFSGLFHACHEGIMLVVLLCLGFRTIDHFIGGYLSRISRKALKRYWEIQE